MQDTNFFPTDEQLSLFELADSLGAEPLAGSGFETEIPDATDAPEVLR
jgi:hypothetical protein